MPAEQKLEPAALQAQVSELENDLKTQLANKTQELSTSEARVAELEKKLKEAETASVKVEGLENQLDQKTKEMSISRGRFFDVEKGLTEILAASQANTKVAKEAMTASQKLEDKIKDLLSQVSGLKDALAIDQQANADKLVEDLQARLTAEHGDVDMELDNNSPVEDLDPFQNEADDTLSLPILNGTYKKKAPEEGPEQSYQGVPDMLPNIVQPWI